jgi:type IX secretion system PorP/SprF family membrane protein
MKRMLCVIGWVFFGVLKVGAQDPSFSQFFSSPLNINPALTANINEDWRFISNLRDQWIGPASPYLTGTASYDRKILQNKVPNVDWEGNVMGIGGMLMFDRAMGGVAKSIYASLDLSYSVKIVNTEEAKHKIAVGFGAIYGRRTVDFSRLDWEEQFTGYGFNTNLPTGEVALSNMKPYVSASVGVTYSFTTEKTNLDMGVAVFHFNKPKQTFLEDENQILAMRKVAHANFEAILNDNFVLNTSGIYQYQDKASYFSLGGALGYYIDRHANTLLHAGVWYWSKNAIVPYLGLTYNDMQVGLSYDITTSKLNQATRKPNTFEISFIIRGVNKPNGIIPCPWK